MDFEPIWPGIQQHNYVTIANLYWKCNPLIPTLKQQQKYYIIQQYSDWYTGRWWVGCTKCNSPPINAQFTNFTLFDVALYLPLDSKGLMRWRLWPLLTNSYKQICDQKPSTQLNSTQLNSTHSLMRKVVKNVFYVFKHNFSTKNAFYVIFMLCMFFNLKNINNTDLAQKT